jgi:uncharacterized membrane protein
MRGVRGKITCKNLMIAKMLFLKLGKSLQFIPTALLDIAQGLFLLLAGQLGFVIHFLDRQKGENLFLVISAAGEASN